MSFPPPSGDQRSDRLQQLATAGLIKARPWDVIGVALAAPMLLWGFLGWFGIAGDQGGGVPGFSSAAGSVGIALVVVASALTLTMVLTGRAHVAATPPPAVLLSGAGAVMILGGMLAKQDSVTILAGSVAGLLTAISQVTVLTIGWVKGSGKVVKASRVAELENRQRAADALAATEARRTVGPPGYPPPGYPPSGLGSYPPGSYPPGSYPPAGYSPGSYPGNRPSSYPGTDSSGVGQYPPAPSPSGQFSQGQPPMSYPPPGPPGARR